MDIRRSFAPRRSLSKHYIHIVLHVVGLLEERNMGRFGWLVGDAVGFGGRRQEIEYGVMFSRITTNHLIGPRVK